MKKRILAAILMLVMVMSFTYVCVAQEQAAEPVQVQEQVPQEGEVPAEEVPVEEVPYEQQQQQQMPMNIVTKEESAVYVTDSSYDHENQKMTITVTNKTGDTVINSAVIISMEETSGIEFIGYTQQVLTGEIKPHESKTITYNINVTDFEATNEIPEVFGQIQYYLESDVNPTDIDADEFMMQQYQGGMGADAIKTVDVPDIFNIGDSSKVTAISAIKNFFSQTGFVGLVQNWKSIIMLIIACFLLYLGIVKQFEPLLLIPIAFGMLLTNLPGAGLYHTELFADGHINWALFGGAGGFTAGLLDLLYLGVKLGIYPCLIFMGVGAMTDFGPLIANPKSLLLGAAAQLGIFVTFVAASFMFTPEQAASIGIIGGADGPTAIFVTSKLAPELLGPIAVAAYSYMALVPVIQPPIMKLLTTKKERQIVMKPLRVVSKTEKIIFPIVVTIFVSLLVPSAAPLVGSLMLGNLAKECGVMERLSKTMQNELMNIVTIFLGITVGATATAEVFLSFKTIAIIVMGVIAFGMGTAGGVLLAKFMNLFLKTKINPLIGSAGVSAVPMAARVSQTVGQKENPKNFLLMHAMGPNVAGVIGSAIAAGVLLALFA